MSPADSICIQNGAIRDGRRNYRHSTDLFAGEGGYPLLPSTVAMAAKTSQRSRSDRTEFSGELSSLLVVGSFPPSLESSVCSACPTTNLIPSSLSPIFPNLPEQESFAKDNNN